MATQQPMAGDLRTLVAVLSITTDLGRIGDRVTNICERVVYEVSGRMQEMNVSTY